MQTLMRNDLSDQEFLEMFQGPEFRKVDQIKEKMGWWLTAFIIVNFCDALSTVVGLSTGIIEETNPLMAWAWNVSPYCFGLIKTLMPLLLIWFFPKSKNPKHALYAIRFLVVAFSVVVIWNIGNLMVLSWLLKGLTL